MFPGSFEKTRGRPLCLTRKELLEGRRRVSWVSTTGPGVSSVARDGDQQPTSCAAEATEGLGSTWW